MIADTNNTRTTTTRSNNTNTTHANNAKTTHAKTTHSNNATNRHGRACPGHPRLLYPSTTSPYLPATQPILAPSAE
jgi:hypothetical protein